MSARGRVYKCQGGDMMVEVLNGEVGELVHHGKPMKLMTENTVDAAKEKHVPVIEKTATGYKVKVGSVAHPMEASHYIQWIELAAGDIVCRKYLKPGAAPEAEFPKIGGKVAAREYCNHGLWKA